LNIGEMIEIYLKERKMKLCKFGAVLITVAFISACASSSEVGTWKCSANGLVNSHYAGGDTAMIQLQGFSSGGQYMATKSVDGSTATGTTANGTAFNCVKTK
jgi:hypothetical protein